MMTHSLSFAKKVVSRVTNQNRPKLPSTVTRSDEQTLVHSYQGMAQRWPWPCGACITQWVWDGRAEELYINNQNKRLRDNRLLILTATRRL